MIRRVAKFLRTSLGATGIEYGMTVALVAIISLVAVEATGGRVSDIFSNGTSSIGAIGGDEPPAGGGDQQSAEEEAFLMFADITDSPLGAEHQATIVFVPEWADGKSAILSGDPSCKLLVNWSEVAAPVQVFADDAIQMEATASGEFDTAASCSISVGSDSGTWTVRTKVDDEPDSFVFQTITNAQPSGETLSNEVVLLGFSGELLLTLDDPESTVILNDIDQGTQFGVVRENDRLRIKTIASADTLTEKVIGVTVGATSSEWHVTTMDPSLVLHMSFDGDLSDSSGHHSNIVGYGGVSTTSAGGLGGYGGALQLNANGSKYVRIFDNPEEFSINEDFTIEMFVKWNNYSGYQGFLSSWAGNGWFLEMSANRGFCLNPNYCNEELKPAINIGEWYHVAVSSENNVLRHFINGKKIAEKTVDFNTPVKSYFSIGWRDGYGVINSLIDELKFYRGRAVYTSDFAPPFANVAPEWSTDPDLGIGMAGAFSSKTITATDPYDPTIIYSLVGGDLPTGMTLGADGVISGTYEGEAGVFTFIARAEDSTGLTADRQFTWEMITDSSGLTGNTVVVCEVGKGLANNFAAINEIVLKDSVGDPIPYWTTASDVYANPTSGQTYWNDSGYADRSNLNDGLIGYSVSASALVQTATSAGSAARFTLFTDTAVRVSSVDVHVGGYGPRVPSTLKCAMTDDNIYSAATHLTGWSDDGLMALGSMPSVTQSTNAWFTLR